MKSSQNEPEHSEIHLPNNKETGKLFDVTISPSRSLSNQTLFLKHHQQEDSDNQIDQNQHQYSESPTSQYAALTYQMMHERARDVSIKNQQDAINNNKDQQNKFEPLNQIDPESVYNYEMKLQASNHNQEIENYDSHGFAIEHSSSPPRENDKIQSKMEKSISIPQNQFEKFKSSITYQVEEIITQAFDEMKMMNTKEYQDIISVNNFIDPSFNITQNNPNSNRQHKENNKEFFFDQDNSNKQDNFHENYEYKNSVNNSKDNFKSIKSHHQNFSLEDQDSNYSIRNQQLSNHFSPLPQRTELILSETNFINQNSQNPLNNSQTHLIDQEHQHNNLSRTQENYKIENQILQSNDIMEIIKVSNIVEQNYENEQQKDELSNRGFQHVNILNNLESKKINSLQENLAPNFKIFRENYSLQIDNNNFDSEQNDSQGPNFSSPLNVNINDLSSNINLKEFTAGGSGQKFENSKDNKSENVSDDAQLSPRPSLSTPVPVDKPQSHKNSDEIVENNNSRYVNPENKHNPSEQQRMQKEQYISHLEKLLLRINLNDVNKRKLVEQQLEKIKLDLKNQQYQNSVPSNASIKIVEYEQPVVIKEQISSPNHFNQSLEKWNQNMNRDVKNITEVNPTQEQDSFIERESPQQEQMPANYYYSSLGLEKQKSGDHSKNIQNSEKRNNGGEEKLIYNKTNVNKNSLQSSASYSQKNYQNFIQNNPIIYNSNQSNYKSNQSNYNSNQSNSISNLLNYNSNQSNYNSNPSTHRQTIHSNISSAKNFNLINSKIKNTLNMSQMTPQNTILSNQIEQLQKSSKITPTSNVNSPRNNDSQMELKQSKSYSQPWLNNTQQIISEEENNRTQQNETLPQNIFANFKEIQREKNIQIFKTPLDKSPRQKSQELNSKNSSFIQSPHSQLSSLVSNKSFNIKETSDQQSQSPNLQILQQEGQKQIDTIDDMMEYAKYMRQNTKVLLNQFIKLNEDNSDNITNNRSFQNNNYSVSPWNKSKVSKSFYQNPSNAAATQAYKNQFNSINPSPNNNDKYRQKSHRTFEIDAKSKQYN